MKCHTIEKKLSAFQDGELSGAEKEQVERHLAGCHSCREQHARLQRTWHVLGDLSEIQPLPGFYKRVSHEIGQTPNKSLLGSHWRNWGLRALPSPAFASVILAIGILFGTYIGNSLMQLKPFHSVAASSEGSFLGSLRVFDPAPPGTLADGYERLLSYNESHAK